LLVAQAGERGGNGGGVVRKVVVHRDAIDRTAHLHASLHAAKAIQCVDGTRRFNTHVMGGRNGGQCIALVVGTGLRPVDGADGAAFMHDLEAAGVRFAHRLPGAAFAKRLDRRPATAFEHPVQGRVVGGHNDADRTRNGAHQVMKLGFNGGQVGKNVGVVEFQIVQNGGTRAVMHELRTLDEEGGVVFV